MHDTELIERHLNTTWNESVFLKILLALGFVMALKCFVTNK